MKVKTSLKQFAGRCVGCDDVYFKLDGLNGMTNRGEIIDADSIEMHFDYSLLCDYTHLTGRLFRFVKESETLTEYSCQVRVSSFEKKRTDTGSQTVLTLIDANRKFEIEPTEQNAILILEQAAQMEALNSESQKV